MSDLPARPEQRASDADREVVAEDLRDAFSEGRLDPDEYQTRLDSLYRARTYGELERLTGDLPQPDLRRREVARKEKKKKDFAEYLGAWKVWAGAAVVMVGIWLFTSLSSGDWANFWPMWPLGIWAIILIAALFWDDDEDQKSDDES